MSNTDWTTVYLAKTYTDMVVVGSPNYSNQEPPLVVRVRNAGTSSFEVSVDRADGSNIAISGIDVHYLVVEEGVYTEASHDIKMEAFKFESGVTDRKGSRIGEMHTYANTYLNPVILGQIKTTNDERFSVFWSRGTSKANPPSASALWVGKHIGEDPDTVRSNENIGYIVFESGLGMINGHEFLAGIGGDSIRGMTNDPPFSYALSGLSSASVAVVSSAGMDGGDGGWPVLYGQNPLTASNLNLAIDEDQLKDTERSHTTEQVGYAIFE